MPQTFPDQDLSELAILCSLLHKLDPLRNKQSLLSAVSRILLELYEFLYLSIILACDHNNSIFLPCLSFL